MPLTCKMKTFQIKVEEKNAGFILALLKALRFDMEVIENDTISKPHPEKTMKGLSKSLDKMRKLKVFAKIKDPLEWQNKQRDEWS